MSTNHATKTRLYCLKEAVDELRTTSRTLRHKMEIGHIDPIRDMSDGRKFFITQDQLDQLRPYFGNTAKASTLETLTEAQYQLEKRIDGLTTQMAQLEKDIAALTVSTAALRSDLHTRETLVVSEFLSQISGAAVFRSPIEKMIEYIETSTHRPPRSPSENTILITSQTGIDLFSYAEHLRQQWQQSLLKALANKWNIRHLIRRISSSDGIAPLVTTMFPLLGAPGNYQPTYFDLHDTPPEWQMFAESNEVVAVPNAGILEVRLSGEPPYRIIQHATPEYVRLYDTLREIANDKSVPLIITHENRIAFYDAIADTDEEWGDRGLFMRGLSQLTLPTDLHEHSAKSLGKTHRDWADKFLTSQRRRMDAFVRQMEKLKAGEMEPFTIRDITTKAALHSYVSTGLYSPDDPYSAQKGEAIKLDKTWRKRHLEHLITLLDAYHPYYQLGLVDDVHLYADPGNYRTFWMVKRKHRVLLEIWRGIEFGQPGDEWDLEIREESVVEVFYRRFVDVMWAGLGTENTDKDSVVNFLQELINEIEEQPN